MIPAVNIPMEPHPVTPTKLFGVEGFSHNLTEDEYRWMAAHNHTVDTSFKGECRWADFWAEGELLWRSSMVSALNSAADGWAIMGNGPKVQGREAIRSYMRKNMGAIRVMRHK